MDLELELEWGSWGEYSTVGGWFTGFMGVSLALDFVCFIFV
jgi:hypothetical protein